MEDALTGVAAPDTRAVRIGAIERELATLWARPDASADEAPSARALMANLVVLCRSDAERAEITGDITTILPHHPSRALLLVADAGNDSGDIEASVRTHARPSAHADRVCGEQITLRAGARAVRRLPATVRALLLGDLPTTLWWATPDAPPLAGELFTELAELADQVIYDSFAWTDPLRQFVVAANWITGGGTRVTSDLAWRRPRLWRRLIAQSLDPALAPGAFESIGEVRIDHGPHTLTQAWLLVGWMAFRLGWQPRGGKVVAGPEVNWSFEWAHGLPRVRIRRLPDGPPEIRKVEIVTKVDRRPVTFIFESQGPGRVTVLADGLSDRQLSLTGPVQPRGALVARQLPDLARDRLFESSVALARTMAEAVL